VLHGGMELIVMVNGWIKCKGVMEIQMMCVEKVDDLSEMKCPMKSRKVEDLKIIPMIEYPWPIQQKVRLQML
jgi:hypothetical protein